MQIAHRSELGYVRTRNEDMAIARELGSGWVVGVADGMGGHPAGDVASKVAVQAIEATLETDLPGTVEPEQTLEAALLSAHDAVLAAAAAEPAYEGMGTTAAIAFVDNEQARLAHVGDSRIYLVRSESATQLTQDHNRQGYLTQALGVPYPIAPDTATIGLQPRDRLLLCTDGLSGLVSDEAIAALASGGPLDEACDRLVDAALTAGGYDNVTVVLVEV